MTKNLRGNFYPGDVSIDGDVGVDIVSFGAGDVVGINVDVKLISKSLTGQKKLTDKEMKSDFCDITRVHVFQRKKKFPAKTFAQSSDF